MVETWMSKLNSAQHKAATCGNGPVLVIAGAGTGKTRTLVTRVAWLIAQGTAPDRILLLTFTRRAAAEMVARARRLTGQSQAEQVWGGTFHAVANRLLRYYGRAIGVSADFTVMDQVDAADLMNLIRGDLGLGNTKSRRRFSRKDTLVTIYSRSVNSRVPLAPLLERHFPWCQDEIEGIRQIFQRYTQRKREQNVLDFDDLLLYWRALCDAESTGATVGDRFDHILVDEYQDTNAVQADLIRAMRRNCRNIMVVGDDAQAIYSFRAATVRNILDFPKHFPGAQVVTLEQNYRSTQLILEASNAVMAEACERYTKHLFSDRGSVGRPIIVTCRDEEEQSREVCDRILARREEGTDLKRQAVLVRAGHHSDHLEIELNRRNVPFVKYGGLKFLEAAHVKDMIAFLRILENPADEMSWYRVLLLLEGIGPVTARKVIAVLFDDRKTSRAEEGTVAVDDGQRGGPLHVFIHDPLPVPAGEKEEFAALRQALSDCNGHGAGSASVDLPPSAQIERLRRLYDPMLLRMHDNGEMRKRDLEQLQIIAGRYRSRSRFITDLTLDPPTSTQDLAGPPLRDDDYLVLSTIHSAKGCEWDAVYIIHAADGMIPSDMATGSEEEIEEERRLLYVAMTRARDALSIYFPLRYYRAGSRFTDRHSYAQLTRFIPESSLHLYDRTGPSRTGAEEHAQDLAVDHQALQSVDTMLQNLWHD